MTKPKTEPQGPASLPPTSGDVGAPNLSASALLATAPDPAASFAVDAELMDAMERRKVRVFDQAVDFAMRDEAFRKRLAAKLRDLGEGTSRRGTSPFELLQVASFVRLMQLQYGGTRRAHLLARDRLFTEAAKHLGISRRAAADRYDRARKLGLTDL